jgi:hypothetical protein
MKLTELGCKEVELVDMHGKPYKASKLLSSSDVGKSPSKYLPDPVFARLKCDGSCVLIAALLSPDRAPAEGPALLVDLPDLKDPSDLALLQRADKIAKGRRAHGEHDSDTPECFLVPLDEFSVAKVGGDDSKLNEAIDAKIAHPLYELLMSRRCGSAIGPSGSA